MFGRLKRSTRQQIGFIEVRIHAGALDVRTVAPLFGNFVLNADDPLNPIMEADLPILRRSTAHSLRGLARALDRNTITIPGEDR